MNFGWTTWPWFGYIQSWFGQLRKYILQSIAMFLICEHINSGFWPFELIKTQLSPPVDLAQQLFELSLVFECSAMDSLKWVFIVWLLTFYVHILFVCMPNRYLNSSLVFHLLCVWLHLGLFKYSFAFHRFLMQQVTNLGALMDLLWQRLRRARKNCKV